ncbi:MAG: YfhO family protein [Bacteroidales bacterium]|jgi:hypothetical protein|nr:YfhO family protein [Bacteroidales bacterium]
MNISEYIRKAFPHILAVAIFITVSMAYFYPLLEGKTLVTNDGTVAQNSAMEISAFRAQYGGEPLWTNSMFGGMPAYLISTLFEGNIMKHVNVAFNFLSRPASFIFIMMLGFYILLLMFKTGWRIAIAGALAYGFSTYMFFIIAAGHNTKAQALAYMAPMIGSIIYAYRYNAIKGALLATLFLTLEIIANHPQITYYAAICVLIFVIIECIMALREKELIKFVKSSLLLLCGAMLAVGMNFGALYTTYEYGKYSTRSKSELQTDDTDKTSGLDKSYITQWSYGVDETLTLLIPGFRGGASKPFDRDSETAMVLRRNNASQYIGQFQQYWGTQPLVDGPVYVGAIIMFLFAAGLIIVKGRERWWLLTAAVVSVMLAWGENFMPLTNLFIDYFPGYNKFRAVTTILVIAEFAIPFLAILALRNIFNGTTSRKDILKAIKTAAGITGGLALLFVIFPRLAGSYVSAAEMSAQLPDWLLQAMTADRQKLLRGDAFRSFMLIVAAAGIIIAFVSQKMKKEYAIVGIAVLFLGDMWFVNKRYLPADRFQLKTAAAALKTPTQADAYILQDTANFRTLNLSVSPFNDASTSYFHKSVGGYHGAKLKRYQELIDTVLSAEITNIMLAAQSAQTVEDLQAAIYGTTGLNMLNTKYIIYSPDALPLVNENAMGNAWFAEEPRLVENANEELAGITGANPGQWAVIDKSFGNLVTKQHYPHSAGDTIMMTSYKANEITYTSRASGERLAVFSEIYYPAGWKSYIDGNEVPHFRANYVLRAMTVPPGNHEITFRFEPASYYAGNRIAYASSGIFVLLVAGYTVLTVLKKRKAE